MKRTQHGFSLLEASIVLAIIGLLAGGVVGGQSLMHNMRLNTVLTNANLYADAMHQFKTQYGYLPGDFPGAARVWGKADGSTNLDTACADALTNASADGEKTCNGNGDGVINGGNAENFWSWQQLAAAKMIPGAYNGIPGTAASYDARPGVNEPKGPLDNTGYFMWSWGANQSDDGTFFAGNYNNAITFGKKVTNSWTEGGALTGAEAAGIEKKADDGLPGQGSVRVLYSSRTSCNTTTDSTTATYVLNSSVEDCTLVFLETYRNKTQL